MVVTLHLHYTNVHGTLVGWGVEQEIRPWTHMMEVPQLHGLGPAANRLLESYSQLLKVLLFRSIVAGEGQSRTLYSGFSVEILLHNNIFHNYSFCILQLLRSLQKMRDSYSAVAAGSDLAIDTAEGSSLSKLVAECEEALLHLNNGLSILSFSLERDCAGGSHGPH